MWRIGAFYMFKKVFLAHSTSNSSKLYVVLMGYDFTSKKPLSFFSDSYAHLSDDEIAKLAKDTDNAKIELHQRMFPELFRFQKIYVKKYKLLCDEEITSKLEDIFAVAVRIFDAQQGHFLYLLRRMINISIKSYSIKKFNQRKARDEALGKRVSLLDNDTPLFSDSHASLQEQYEQRAIKLDFLHFLNTLSSQKRLILELYCRRFTVTQIARIIKIPYSTCMTYINNLKNIFFKKIHYKLNAHKD